MGGCCGQLWVKHMICGQTCDGLYHFTFYLIVLGYPLDSMRSVSPSETYPTYGSTWVVLWLLFFGFCFVAAPILLLVWHRLFQSKNKNKIKFKKKIAKKSKKSPTQAIRDLFMWRGPDMLTIHLPLGVVDPDANDGSYSPLVPGSGFTLDEDGRLFPPDFGFLSFAAFSSFSFSGLDIRPWRTDTRHFVNCHYKIRKKPFTFGLIY